MTRTASLSIARLARLATLVLLISAPASAAPPTKRCIEAAESGQELRSQGKLMEARKAFAICTSPSCPTPVRRDCGRWIEEVDVALPTVAVRLEDEGGHELAEGNVLIDDTAIEPSAGRAVAVNPGAHRFTWVRADGKIEQSLVIREGEHNRVIILRASAGAVASGGPTPVVGPERPATQPAPRSSVLPLVVGGIGIVALGVGGGFWFAGLRQRSNLEQTCKDSRTCQQSDIDASRTKLIVGDILVGVGVVAIAGALYLYLSQTNDPPRPSAQR